MIVENIFQESMGAKIVPEFKSETLYDLDLKKLSLVFQKKKMLLFRDFNANKDDFVNFSETIGDDFLTYQGGAYERKMISGKNNLLSVTGFSKKNLVPLHAEMYYKKIKPKLLWFYCNIPPLKGGQTTVCDARLFYESLSYKTKIFFETTQITYVRRYSEDKWKAIFNVETLHDLYSHVKEEGLKIYVKDGNLIETQYTCNAIQTDNDGECYFLNNIMPVVLQQLFGKGDVSVKLDNGKNLPLKIVFELFKIARKNTRHITWQKGDIVLIDNHKLLHGRTRIKDLNRDIYVRMSQSKLNGE